MIIEIPSNILGQIHANGEAAYPNEGAGLLLGEANEQHRRITAILPLSNAREDSARHNRYLITAKDMMYGEDEAMRRGLDVIGVFHSHPDHPNQPSEYDRDWALPWYSYIITTVKSGSALESRSWQLREDRQEFLEEELQIIAAI